MKQIEKSQKFEFMAGEHAKAVGYKHQIARKRPFVVQPSVCFQGGEGHHGIRTEQAKIIDK